MEMSQTAPVRIPPGLKKYGLAYFETRKKPLWAKKYGLA